MPAQLTLFAEPAGRASRPKSRPRARPRSRRPPAPQTTLMEFGRWTVGNSANPNAQGDYYDLEQIAEEVNRTYFGGKLSVRIRWGRNAPRRRRRYQRSVSIQLGSFDARTGEIRVHPRLDAHDVPDYVVRNVVYHEMLHQFLGPERRGGRVVYHSAAFRALEKRCAGYDRAHAWESRLIRELA